MDCNLYFNSKNNCRSWARSCASRRALPVKPMLAKATGGISEVLDKFAGQPFTCEYKYDGQRAQVHLTADGEVFIYRCAALDGLTRLYATFGPPASLTRLRTQVRRASSLWCSFELWVPWLPQAVSSCNSMCGHDPKPPYQGPKSVLCHVPAKLRMRVLS